MKSCSAAIAKTRLRRDIAVQRNGGYWKVIDKGPVRVINLALGPVFIVQNLARLRWVYLR